MTPFNFPQDSRFDADQADGRQQRDEQRNEHRHVHLAQMRAAIDGQNPSGPLSEAELHDLREMRAEEKIARDVYVKLNDRWGLRPFANISGSEQVHMDAVLALLHHYGHADPVAGLAAGQFHSPQMQALHDQLLQQGLKSEADAIAVGLHIEELDIADLRAAASRTDRSEIRAVYDELERGSRNHLRAFYRWAQRFGLNYSALHLTQSEFEAIGTSSKEACDVS